MSIPSALIDRWGYLILGKMKFGFFPNILDISYSLTPLKIDVRAADWKVFLPLSPRWYGEVCVTENALVDLSAVLYIEASYLSLMGYCFLINN